MSAAADANEDGMVTIRFCSTARIIQLKCLRKFEIIYKCGLFTAL